MGDDKNVKDKNDQGIVVDENKVDDVKDDINVQDDVVDFHKKQESLFREMSKLFAFGKDEDAIQLREVLKMNISDEFYRLKEKLTFSPPRLSELQNEISEEFEKLKNSLHKNDKRNFANLSDALWVLRKEMKGVEDSMKEEKKKTEAKIQELKKRYGILVPSDDISEEDGDQSEE